MNPDLGAGLADAGDCEIQLSWAEGLDRGAGGADLGEGGGALEGCEIQLSVAEACERGAGCGGAGLGAGAGAGVPLSNQLPRSGCCWVGSEVCVWLAAAEWTEVLEAAARGAGGAGGGWVAGCPPNQLSIAEAPERAAAGGGTGIWWAPDEAGDAWRRASGACVGMTMVGSDHAASLGAGGGFGAGGGAWS